MQLIHGHYSDVIMGAMASQITSLAIVYSTIYSCTDQRKHQRSAWPVNSPHKGPVTRKIFPLMRSSWVTDLYSGLAPIWRQSISGTNYVTVCPSNLQWRRDIKRVQHYWLFMRETTNRFPSQRTSHTEHWCFIFCWPEQKSLWIFYFIFNVPFYSLV